MTNSTSDIRVLKKDKVVPHYLKVPDGSCHINCKIGYKPTEIEIKSPHRRKLLAKTYSFEKEAKNSTIDTTLARHNERQRPNEIRSPRKKEDSKSSTTLIDKHQFVKKVVPRLAKTTSMSSNNLLSPIDKDEDQTKPRLGNIRRMSEVILRKETKLGSQVSLDSPTSTSRRLIERRKTISGSPNVQNVSLSRPSSSKGGLSKTPRKTNNNSTRETRNNQQHIPEVSLAKLDEFLDEKKIETLSSTCHVTNENNVSSSQLSSILIPHVEDDVARSEILEENLENVENMKFKRGTIIDVENEDNGPYRLKFNEGSTISQLGEVGKEEIDLREVVTIEKMCESQNEDKINLKHVDELEKDKPSSLDDMIEEAANKLLVRSKKNKVKALVGAFETVMSIQDAKSLSRKRSL
ncbi:uncharacterized protein LOC124918018 [Impatiens glandulifera]|uniref:uncharacterized protein LOC124918018 n=1 Tax=Impatiens glandulifera TaxID=253017 RepID=UPI001FB06F86|nr:uncharacterized protein LOC124918018 [Impatiens glandulifera]